MSRAWLLLVLAIAGCGGGGGESEFEQAFAAAGAKEAQAASLGVATPCGQVDQCGSLQFANPTTRSCGTYHYQPYSLVSGTAAAASAAAAQQRDLAAVSRSLDKPNGVFCPGFVEPPPALACVANRCQVAAP